jgi:hypothetical protein
LQIDLFLQEQSNMKPPMGGETSAYDAEYLAASAGRMANRVRAILTFRLNSEASFAALNIAISKEQAIRLRDDLNYVFENYLSMKAVEDVDEPKADPENPPETPRCPRRHGRKRRPK